MIYLKWGLSSLTFVTATLPSNNNCKRLREKPQILRFSWRDGGEMCRHVQAVAMVTSKAATHSGRSDDGSCMALLELRVTSRVAHSKLRGRSK
jgi:hypothetical protein